MADNYREETTRRKRGRSSSKLSVKLFLLDPDKNITKVTKEIGSEKGLNELKQKGYGPPSKAGGKVEFSLELTNEEFKQKLVEIYPSLENVCFMFMKAGKDNTLKELNPGVCCYRCYTPENVYFSDRGQGKLYIRMIAEEEISPCNHGVPPWKRLRSTVGGHQQLYVPIAPKPVATVIPAPSTTLPSASTSTVTVTVTSAATPTNHQLSSSGDLESNSRTSMRSQPVPDFSSSMINVAQVASTPAGQNSGNMVTQTPLLSTAGTILPIQRFKLFEKSTGQGPSSVSMAATRPEAQGSDNTVTQSQLSASPVVNQNASSADIHDSVGTNSLPQPSKQINSSVDIVPQGQLPTSATVSQTASALPVNSSVNLVSPRQMLTPYTNFQPNQAFNSSFGMVPPGQLPAPATNSQAVSTLPVNGLFNTLSREQTPVLATNSLNLPTQSLYNPINMVPQRQLATSATGSQMVIRPVHPFVSENTTPESQILRSAGVSDESVTQSSLDAFSQLVTQSSHTSVHSDQELYATETGYQEPNEANHELCGSSSVSSAISSMAQSPNLDLLAQVIQAQHEQYEHIIASGANVQRKLEAEQEQEQTRVVKFLQNVELTGKREISLDVLNNDALLKKLNESTISIHTVEIQSTCEVDQVLKKFSLPSCLKVLRINENNLNLGQVSELVKFLTVGNLEVLDMSSTKFKENSFVAFICALYHCKHLTSLILRDNNLTEQEINSLITALESIKNLKILTLSKCILTETQANAILHKHEQAKNFVSLDLSHSAIQGNEIIVGLCQLQSLEELDLSHNCVRFSPLPNLEGKRNHLSTCLKVISLSSNHMKLDDISQFCSLIRSDLSELNLDFNHIGHSVWSLCSLGEKIKHLKVLSLANTDICDNVDGLAFLLSLVRELEDLNLSSNNLMAADFQQLQTPLSKSTQLNTLSLSMNAIGSDGMKALADIFKKFPLLERLDMNSSYIREDEVSVLCKSLASLNKLKYLNLSGNCIDVEVLDDALVLPATLEELLFSDFTHGNHAAVPSVLGRAFIK